MKRTHSAKKGTDVITVLVFLRDYLGTFKIQNAFVPLPFNATTGNLYTGCNRWMLIRASQKILKEISSKGGENTSLHEFGKTYPFLPGFATYNQATNSKMPILRGTKMAGLVKVFNKQTKFDAQQREYEYLFTTETPVFWMGHCKITTEGDNPTDKKVIAHLQSRKDRIHHALALITAKQYIPKPDCLVGLCLKALIKAKQEGKYSADQGKVIHDTLKQIGGEMTKHGFSVGIMWPIYLYDAAEERIASWIAKKLVPPSFLSTFVKPAPSFVDGVSYYTRLMTACAVFVIFVTPQCKKKLLQIEEASDAPVESAPMEPAIPKSHSLDFYESIKDLLKCHNDDCVCHHGHRKNKKCTKLHLLAAIFFAMELCHGLEIAVCDMYYFQVLVAEILRQDAFGEISVGKSLKTQEIVWANSDSSVVHSRQADTTSSSSSSAIMDGTDLIYSLCNPMISFTDEHADKLYVKIKKGIEKWFT